MESADTFGLAGMMASPSPELAILRHLATRTHASAAEIGTACRTAPGEVRARLAHLKT